MIYKNSMKLFTSNFSLVWKQLAYTLIRLAIISGLVLLVSNPIVRLLIENGFHNQLMHLWETVYTDFPNFFVELKATIVMFVNIISNNFAAIGIFVVLFLFVIIFVNAYLKYMGRFALTNVAYNKFTSLNTEGYSHSIITNMTNIAKYSVAKFLFDLPFWIIKIVYLVIYCLILDNFASAIIGLPILIMLFILTYSLQITLFVGVAGEQISRGINPIKAFKGIYKCQKDFWKVFSNAIVLLLTIIVLGGLTTIFTLGVGFILVVPASMTLVVMFELVSYLSATRQRYYLSPTIIVDPISEKTETK